MTKRTASLILGLLANAEAQKADLNGIHEANDHAMIGNALP